MKSRHDSCESHELHFSTLSPRTRVVDRTNSIEIIHATIDPDFYCFCSVVYTYRDSRHYVTTSIDDARPAQATAALVHISTARLALPSTSALGAPKQFSFLAALVPTVATSRQARHNGPVTAVVGRERRHAVRHCLSRPDCSRM